MLLSLVNLLLLGAMLPVGPFLAAIAFRRSLAMPWQVFLVGICILHGLSPFIAASLGLSLAESYGCEADITLYACSGNPEMGDIVTNLTFAPWAAVITLPSGLAGVIGLCVASGLQSKRSQSGAPAEAGSGRFFYRSRRRKAIAGVCAAVARRFGLSVLLVRIGVVWFSLITPGIGFLVYLVLWLAIPLEPIGNQADEGDSNYGARMR
ncbi:MAG TPA: PspC domain-containing protein [Trichocoleus sp.]